MKDKKQGKKPDLRLRVLYVTPARSRIVRLPPNGNRISLSGGESAKCTRAHLFPKGSPFDAIWVQGQSECVPVEQASPVSSYEYDAAAETDFIQQVQNLARGAKVPQASWWLMGLQAAVLLGLVIVAIVINGNVSDMETAMHQLHAVGGGSVRGGPDTTVYRPGGGS